MKIIALIIVAALSAGIAWTVNMNHHSFEIPLLKTRSTSLYPKEFQSQQKKYQTAVEGIHHDPKNAKSYCLLAKVLMVEARVTGDHPYYYPAAMNVLDEALNQRKDDFEATMLKGSVLLSLHHFAEAKQLVTHLSGIYGYNAALYGMLCDANVELGQYDEAVSAVDNMMHQRPGLEAYARSAYLREIHGDVQGSIEAMNLAVSAGMIGSEDLAWTRVTLGNMYMKYSELDKAEGQFRATLSERENYPGALSGLALVLSKQGKNDEALQLLDKALALQPEVSFVERKAEICRATGNTAQSDSLMLIAEKMMDEDAAAGHINHAERAIAYSRAHFKPADALSEAMLEVMQRPDNITAEYAMASALNAVGRQAEARVYITKALRTGINDPDIIACARQCNAAIPQATSTTKPVLSWISSIRTTSGNLRSLR